MYSVSCVVYNSKFNDLAGKCKNAPDVHPGSSSFLVKAPTQGTEGGVEKRRGVVSWPSRGFWHLRGSCQSMFCLYT